MKKKERRKEERDKGGRYSVVCLRLLGAAAALIPLLWLFLPFSLSLCRCVELPFSASLLDIVRLCAVVDRWLLADLSELSVMAQHGTNTWQQRHCSFFHFLSFFFSLSLFSHRLSLRSCTSLLALLWVCFYTCMPLLCFHCCCDVHCCQGCFSHCLSLVVRFLSPHLFSFLFSPHRGSSSSASLVGRFSFGSYGSQSGPVRACLLDLPAATGRLSCFFALLLFCLNLTTALSVFAS